MSDAALTVSVSIGPQSNGSFIIGLHSMEDWTDFVAHAHKITGDPRLKCYAPDEDEFPCLTLIKGVKEHPNDPYLNILDAYHIPNVDVPDGYHYTDDPIELPNLRW